MKTFSIQTLGCKVNQYEGDQLAAALRARGLVEAPAGLAADLRVIHTCSVTVQAASKSRQSVRRATRHSPTGDGESRPSPGDQGRPADAPRPRSTSLPILTNRGPSATFELAAGCAIQGDDAARPRVIVTGCWATSDRAAAAALPGVDAVLTNGDDIATELDRLLLLWQTDPATAADLTSAPADDAGFDQPLEISCEPPSEPSADDGWMKKAGAPAGQLTPANKSKPAHPVNENPGARQAPESGFASLPVLGERQGARRRAYLKIQDGCDAHCTYCIIPKLRPRLWSKPVEVAVEEARRLVAAGHAELVLTGIFLGAYGRPTALRRRQPSGLGAETPLAELVRSLCTRVPGLRRLRLSSLEPGDLTPELVAVLRDHAQVVPHFHLPLQSGSDLLLRRMNRQYTRGDFLHMLDRVRAAFDRPALTTDVIVGFPGETDDEFAHTIDVVAHGGFIHVHAFSFSPRPGTAAARWGRDFVRGPVVNERIDVLRGLAARHDLAFRRQFLGETVELLIEGDAEDDAPPERAPAAGAGTRHGRCERYFSVSVDGAGLRTGDFVRARVVRAEPGMTFGEVLR